ncbi:MAG: efflux RND transporter permease subunit [Armatimonadetes bacterium]|nr:efflux RND transporter permease subunit [Armatimonadota bacterium]
MWLTRVAITRPVTITMFMVGILVLGIYSLGKMKVEMNPKTDFPIVTVATSYPGAPPDEIETLVTKPIEDAAGAVSGVKSINSVSQYGLSIVTVEFYLGTDTNIAFSDVRAKVDAARGELPREVLPPVVSKLDNNIQPVLYISMTGRRSAADLRDLADNVIKDRLGNVSGVASVEVAGGEQREIQITVNRTRLEAYQLTIGDVQKAIQAASLNVPAGQITEGAQEYGVRMLGEFKSIDEIRDLKLPLQNRRDPNSPGPAIRLKDVADVRDTTAERRVYTRLNGKDNVAIVVQQASDASAVDVADGVKAVIGEIGQEYPDLQFTYTQDMSENIKESIFDLRVALFMAVILVVLIVYLFLYNLRGTFIVSLAIPTCIFATFILINFLGFSINFMTMMALSLAVGILVDDAIVVLENTYRHLTLGEDPVQAAYNGRSEIGIAAITITLIDVVVFLPIAFMGGITGQFFKSFGITIAAATLFSLFVSFTITPMLASRWYRKGEGVEEPKGFFKWFDRNYRRFERGYRRVLAFALNHRWFVVLTGNGALIGLMVVIGWAAANGKDLLPFRFAPGQDQGQISVHVKLPPDSSLAQTDAVVKRIEEAAMELDDARYVSSRIGSSSTGAWGAGDRGPQFADVSVTLHHKKSLLDSILFWQKHDEALRTRLDTDIAAELREKIGVIPGARISVSAVSGFGGGWGAPINMTLSGKDTAALVQTADAVKAVIARIPGIKDPDLSWQSGKPEIQAAIDRVRAASLGVSSAEVAGTLRTALEGNTDVKYREFGREYPIRIQFRPEDRAEIGQVGDVVVSYVGGMPIRLRDVASMDVASGPTKIQRNDRQRQIGVLAQLQPGYSPGNMAVQVREELSKANVVPPGIALGWEGENKVMADESGYMGAALMLAFILVYLLMAALFENMLTPLVIMFSQPQALVGALLALIITGVGMNIVAMIGIIMLVGLVGKNAILLVDYTGTLRARGLPRREALLEAGPTRLRPIMMTTIAMVLGMMPIALALGRGSEFRAPLGIAVIGGLIVSTLLTLVVIPATYTILDDFSQWTTRLKNRALGRTNGEVSYESLDAIDEGIKSRE